MHEGSVAAWPVQQQACLKSVRVSLDGLRGQVPLLTHTSISQRRTMSEPVRLLDCSPDSVGTYNQSWEEKEVDSSSPEESDDLDSQQSGHCVDLDLVHEEELIIEESDLETAAGAMLLHQEDTLSPASSCPGDLVSAFSLAQDNSGCSPVPASVTASEDPSVDSPRIVKHQPSVIVFCDFDKQVVSSNRSSDGAETSSSNTGEAEGDNDEDDDFPETLQYKEFLVSRRRRNLSRNRKCLRKRQDAQPNSSASGCQKHSNQGTAELAASDEEEEESDGKQVRRNTAVVCYG